jgi:aspartate dehydrogenase
MAKLKVGIIGCGAIGTEIAKACQGRLKDKIDLSGICDIDEKKASVLNKVLVKNVPILNLEDIIKNSGLIVEAASAAMSADVLEKCIDAGRDCLMMSVGGLLGREELLRKAKEKNTRVYIPSGAICGIDGLKSASVGRVASVTLTTRKPPKGLAGAPYLKENNIDVLSIKEEKTIFEGSAEEAVKGFPQNVNVSAVLSLAGIGAKKTRVKIVTSPAYTANIHEIEITGEFGRIVTRSENLPSKANPKTSALAIFSAIATLEGIVTSVKIGT